MIIEVLIIEFTDSEGNEWKYVRSDEIMSLTTHYIFSGIKNTPYRAIKRSEFVALMLAPRTIG